uniref:Uncharacterized protein n=1 Tax=Lepeophtheirus salmonis TaxID=72036 RepID=A0A0K2U1D9_LEPSM
MVQNGFMINVQLLGDATNANIPFYMYIFHHFIHIFDNRSVSGGNIIQLHENFLGRFRRLFSFRVVKMLNMANFPTLRPPYSTLDNS